MGEETTKKILIVEDQNELALGLSSLLKSQGYVTTIANDGIYGTSQAHKGDIDLVILDLGLPAGGGFSVLANLKSSTHTNNIPIIVLTAQQGEESRNKAYKMGAQAFLNKPFDPEKLLDCINRLIKK
ncbi:MAG: response regulator transcription factor [Candidatus Omnitrophota bacterium]